MHRTRYAIPLHRATNTSMLGQQTMGKKNITLTENMDPLGESIVNFCREVQEVKIRDNVPLVDRPVANFFGGANVFVQAPLDTTVPEGEGVEQRLVRLNGFR